MAGIELSYVDGTVRSYRNPGDGGGRDDGPPSPLRWGLVAVAAVAWFWAVLAMWPLVPTAHQWVSDLGGATVKATEATAATSAPAEGGKTVGGSEGETE